MAFLRRALLSSLLAVCANAVELKVNSVDSRNCPFGVTATPLSDGSGFSIKYDTKSTALAAIGSGVAKEENSKLCYISIAYQVSPNAQVIFQSLELEAQAELGEGVEASVSADFIWEVFTSGAALNTYSLKGPHSGSFLANLTDTAKPYQSYCQYGDGPISTQAHIRTHFDLKGSGTGSLGKGAVVEQVLRFKYDSTCEPFSNKEGQQFCYIGRGDEYLCNCGPGTKRDPDPRKAFGPCEKWTRFPPNPPV